MRRSIIVLASALLIQLLVVSTLAQDKLAGKWTGKIKAPQGERDAEASFTKEGDKYTGKISGARPGQDITFKEVKVDSDNVTAVAEVETPQGMLVINYKFTLKGDALTGQGSLDFNGNPFSFDYE